ncbi:MAG TPA: cold shock and DUF1294 domain-containing protein [Candidatus Limnocylindrales bacterium]|jgi:uncharacterized membrane protein YsdA (DUF1294 family)/cold shock CspA family protein|nr:cold shock and DUF1294 domain-containing protein [Candidatus Limnocylindrales bacterium]
MSWGRDTADSSKQAGRLLKWNDGRGFGFILPEAGGDTVFVHISGFLPGARRPKEGDVVYYDIEHEQRRTKAVNVRIKALPLPDTVKVAYGVGLLWLAIFFLFLAGVVEPALPIIGYLVMSIVTFGFYYADKKRAETNRWRITGTSLHVLEAVGGWPGAVLAMAMLRHLTRKREHLTMLCAIIAIHVAVWVVWYLFT